MGQKTLDQDSASYNSRTLHPNEHGSAAAEGAKILRRVEVLVEGQPSLEKDSSLMLLVVAHT